MTFQIISSKTLLQYLTNRNILLIDLRSYGDYLTAHISDALWMNWEHACDELGLLLNHYYCLHGKSPDEIVLYCHSGRISLQTAKILSRAGYHVLTLNGGYEAWLKESFPNSPLEFHYSL